MPYATQDNLIARYGTDEVTGISDRGATGLLDEDVVAVALNDASVEMDAYLSIGHTLPLATPYPALLVRLCCELARYALYKDKASEAVRTAREDAIALLRRIANGEASLQLASGTPVTDAQGNAFQVSASARVFSGALLATIPGSTAWN